MTRVLIEFLSMKILLAVKNTYLLKSIKKETIYIGNICGLTMGGSISEKMKMTQSLQSKQKTICIVSSNMIHTSWDYRVVVSYYYVCSCHSHCLQMLVLWHHVLYHLTQMAVNDQCALCNLHTGCKMMCIICKKWTHPRGCYVTYDNFAMCLPCNHNCFPFSEISNIELLGLFPSTTKIIPTTFNEISFSLAEPHVPNDYPTPSEINSANSMFCHKHSYFYFNVRSLARNKHKIDTSFSICNVSPDFVAISETKLKSKCCTNKQIPNYNFVHVDSLTYTGGVGLYVNKKLQYTIRQDLELPIDGCESLFIEVKSNNVSGKKCIVGVIYRNPSNSQAFQLAFTNLLEIMHSEKSNYIIGGDINLNFLKYQIDTHITDYDSVLSLGCISLMNKPTRFSSTHQPSQLDHIDTNIIDDNTTTGIALSDISDYLPIFANFNFHPKCAKKYRPKIRCLKNFDLPSFLEDLNTALFDLDFHNQNNSDINITCNNFILMFNNILDQHAPLRFASRKETRSFHKPWLTKGLLTSISKKNALYKKMLSTNNPSISAKYQFYRNKITHLKESLKQN